MGSHVVASVASRPFWPLLYFDFTFLFSYYHRGYRLTSLRCLSLHRLIWLDHAGKMDEDPINNFFTPKEVEDPKILYTTLTITSTATSEDIRKAYRKLALRYHPDKHTTKNASEKEELGRTFQRVGFAYAVLSDEARRKRYVYLCIYFEPYFMSVYVMVTGC